MKKVLPVIATLVMLGCSLLIPVANVQACSRAGPFRINELFDNAEMIVRATAVKYAKPPADPRFVTTGEPDSTIEFKIEEKLRGKDVPDKIILNGYLSDKDDFNELPVPYMFVRSLGRRGSCFANTYKEGAQFLLFLKKTKDGFTPDISALGPTNEQLHSDNDEWLIWVREHLRSLKKNGKESAPQTQRRSEGGYIYGGNPTHTFRWRLRRMTNEPAPSPVAKSNKDTGSGTLEIFKVAVRS